MEGRGGLGKLGGGGVSSFNLCYETVACMLKQNMDIFMLHFLLIMGLYIILVIQGLPLFTFCFKKHLRSLFSTMSHNAPISSECWLCSINNILRKPNFRPGWPATSSSFTQGWSIPFHSFHQCSITEWVTPGLPRMPLPRLRGIETVHRQDSSPTELKTVHRHILYIYIFLYWMPFFYY